MTKETTMEDTLAKTESGSQRNRGLSKIREGLVVSNAMEKTVLVEISRKVKHPAYKKYVVKTNKLMAHDDANDCQVGDRVRIVETRPLSKRKRWRVREVITRAVKV